MSETKRRRKSPPPTKTSRKKPTSADKLSLKEALTPGTLTDSELHELWQAAVTPLQEFLVAHSQRYAIARRARLQENLKEIRIQIQAAEHELSMFLPPWRSRGAHLAEGERFRKQFIDLTPGEVTNYLITKPINVWWLAGFSGDPAMLKRMRENAQRPRRRKPKWSAEVREVAEKAYREWMKNANQPHPAWEPSWGAFAKACIDLIEQKTGVRVPEEALRRSILPAKKFPRPD